MIFSHVLYQLSYPATLTAAARPKTDAACPEAGATGLEPAISGLTGQRVNHYTTPPIGSHNGTTAIFWGQYLFRELMADILFPQNKGQVTNNAECLLANHD